VSKPKAPAKSAKAATKATAAAKPAAKKSTAPAKPAAKAAAQSAAKAAAKPAAKPAAAKTPAKPVAGKPAAKPEAVPATRPATKSAAIPQPKPAAPPAKPTRPADKPVTSAPAQAAPSRQSAGAPVLSEAAAAAAVLTPSSAAAAQRFTDRFAPARPAVREVIEVPAAKPARKIDPKLANAWKTKPGRELTEEELLAMPDSEYMHDKQLEFFRARLQQQKDDLLSNAGETTEHLREDTTIVPDPADRATIEEEHALELRTRDRERKLLKKIAQSLARLDSGDYGYCDETGEPIGLARLLARPTATLSLEAQQRRELKQKMFGD